MELPVGRGLGLVLIAFIFLVILQDLQSPEPDTGRLPQQIVQTERQALEELSKTKYGDLDTSKNRWINITGLREHDRYAWDLLPRVQARAREQAEAVLRTSHIQSGHDNIRNLKLGDFGERYTTFENLDSISAAPVIAPFYRNLTGLVKGTWLRSKIGQDLPPPSLNSTILSDIPYVTQDFTRNITSQRGDLHLKLDQKKSFQLRIASNVVQELKGELTISDESASGDGWELILHGVHFVESGSAILTTSSEKFAGIFALPHFARSSTGFALSQELLNRTLRTVVTDKDISKNPESPWASSWDNQADAMFPVPRCEYVVYLQQHFVWPYLQEGAHAPFLPGVPDDKNPAPSYLTSLEQELRRPTGASLNFVPELRFSALILSPDCGFVLETDNSPDTWYKVPGNHLKGPKVEVYLTTLRWIVEVFCLVIAGQVLLLIRQMKDASTPSTKSRISYYTVAMMTLGDGFVFGTSMIFGLFLKGIYLILICVSFLTFINVTFFGLSFLVEIWTIQAPEREREILNARDTTNSSSNSNVLGASNTPTVVITPAGPDLLPAPATARRSRTANAIPIILPPDQDIEAAAAEDDIQTGQQTGQANAVTSRFNMGLKFLSLSFCLTILSYIASSWPTTIRSFYTNFIVFLYLSFWVPQIKRNIMRNCRKALRWDYVVGQSILRLIPLAYCYLDEDNVFFSKTDYHMFEFFVAWQWAQILALLSQDILGPRFFIPTGFLPPAYDYHQALREGDEEDSGFMPIGFTQAAGSPANSARESKEKNKWTFDCIICMHPLEASYIPRRSERSSNPSNPSTVSDIFARRDYMITPCRHIFHSSCLNGWMKYKLQCPICRENLPPL
jgi:transmembrane E3 ubiquitin-protein ligase